MRVNGWLLAICTIVVTSHAWPTLPHFELQQAGNANANANSVQRSIQGTCKRIVMLKNLSNMATNQTLLDDLLAEKKLTQDQVDYIEARKDAINFELQELSSNATLTTECETIDAHREAVRDCKKLDKLEKLAELASNKTAYNEHLAGEVLNQKQMEQLQKNMEDAEIKLQELRSNNTLVKLCTEEIGLQQNSAVGQQDGAIGDATVDNSGAISLSTSDANLSLSVTWTTTYALALGLFVAFAFL
ncbi:hypothetical protein N0V94_001196 [Neodidymelliopsis sp. IMI 364377]|nr:hypothetical protein N0V94_001196 [Neodidymelliopsis sp. IMI 364377]